MILVAGCTTVPAKDFAAYKEAFGAARSAGEEVLLDYSAALEQRDRLAAEVSAAELQDEAASLKRDVEELREERESADRFRFTVQQFVAAESAEDDVAVRMRAWQVVEAYNDALTALAEGRPASEVGSAVDGLLQAIGSLPIDAVQAALKTFAPFAPDVKQVLALVQKEMAARRFARAVRAASPLIKGFLRLLLSDADNFYNVRFGLYEREYNARYASARILQKNLSVLLVSFIPSPSSGSQTAPEAAATTVPVTVPVNLPPTRLTMREDSARGDQELIQQVNADLLKFSGWRRDNLLATPNRPTGARREPAAQTQLMELAIEVRNLAEQAKAADARMLAYKQVVTNYVRLVLQLEVSVDGLLKSVDEAPRSTPPIADLLRVVLNVRRSLASFDKAEKTE
jgi:hypothetical protein